MTKCRGLLSAQRLENRVHSTLIYTLFYFFEKYIILLYFSTYNVRTIVWFQVFLTNTNNHMSSSNFVCFLIIYSLIFSYDFKSMIVIVLGLLT